MTNEPRLPMDLIRIYFKNTKITTDRYSVDVELYSYGDAVAFNVGIKMAEPHRDGAYPQRRFSLERHFREGHEGVHVQIWYHLVENTMNLGTLYIVLDVHNDGELLDVAEGFVFTLHEMLLSMGADFREIAWELFHTEMVEGLRSKKAVLTRKLSDSLNRRMIEVRRSDTKEATFISGKELIALLESRRELVPLLGPLAERDEE